jgi:hypothetical protein
MTVVAFHGLSIHQQRLRAEALVSILTVCQYTAVHVYMLYTVLNRRPFLLIHAVLR